MGILVCWFCVASSNGRCNLWSVSCSASRGEQEQIFCVVTVVAFLVLLCVVHRVIILIRGSMFFFQWREFSPPLSSAHRLLQCYHSQWEIGDAAIPGEFPLSSPPLGPLANERAVSCNVTHSGRENLHQFLPILLWRHALSSSIMTLWCGFWEGVYNDQSALAFVLMCEEFCVKVKSWSKGIMNIWYWWRLLLYFG